MLRGYSIVSPFLCMRRRQLTDPESEVGLLEVGDLEDYGIQRKDYKAAWNAQNTG